MAKKLIHSNFFYRLVHLSCYNSANIHRSFRKVLSSNASKKRKFKFQDFPVIQSPSNFKQVEEKTKIKPVFRRVNVLNKMFMGYITDLIVNGEYWENYSNLGIEITKVEISPDYKKLNIFWISKKPEKKNDALKFLAENSFALRHELSQLKVVGVVPPLAFVEDKHYTQIMELDKRMEQADYGEEYEPLSVSRLKHQLELYCPLEENVKIQLEKLELNEEDVVDMELPDMPENVLGLDRSDIVKKIMHPKKPKSVQGISGDSFMPRKPLENLEDPTLSRDAFKTFLHKRQIISQKMKKEDKNYIPDKEYIKGELNRSFEEHYENIEENLDKFDDFVEEENDEK